MGRPSLLTNDDIANALGAIPGWIKDGKHLRRTLHFETFAEAFGFMATIAIVCDKIGHHPEWSNVYNQVDVGLTTHDAGGITQLDLDLAAAMNRAARASTDN